MVEGSGHHHTAHRSRHDRSTESWCHLDTVEEALQNPPWAPSGEAQRPFLCVAIAPRAAPFGARGLRFAAGTLLTCVHTLVFFWQGLDVVPWLQQSRSRAVSAGRHHRGGRLKNKLMRSPQVRERSSLCRTHLHSPRPRHETPCRRPLLLSALASRPCC